MDIDQLSTLFAVAAVSLVAAISPGPDFFIVVRNSLSHSRRAGLFTALGVSLGLLIHLTYTLVGLAVLIVESPLAYNVLKYAGALYLGYLGVTSIIASFKGQATLEVSCASSRSPVSDGSMIRQGFLTNALNPKAAVFFLSLFSQFISADTSVLLRLEYAFINWAVTLAWFLFLAYLITGQVLTSRLGRARVYVDRVMGTLLVLLSIRILVV